MKNKIYKVLLPVYSVICLVLLVGISYAADDYPIFESQLMQFLLSLGLCILGGIVGNAIHLVLHEIGHVVPLLKKAEIFEFSVLFVTFLKADKGYKVKLFKNSKYGGAVAFVGKSPETAGVLVFSSALWAWVATLISLVVYAFSFYLSNSYIAYCLLGGATLGTFYSLLVNFLSGMPSSDGTLLFRPDRHTDRVFALCETESRLYLGDSLLDMNERLFYSEENKVNSYYSYLRLMQKGDLENAKKMLEICCKENEKTFDNEPIALDLEKFYLALIENDQATIDYLKDDVVYYCDKNINATTLRVMVKYRKFTGETDWERALRATFERQSDGVFKGLFKTEKDVYDKFS